MTMPGVAYALSIGYCLLRPQYIKNVEQENEIFYPAKSPLSQAGVSPMLIKQHANTLISTDDVNTRS